MKYVTHDENPGGYTRWIRPGRHRGHRIRCCDCRLVHEFDFRTVLVRGRASKDALVAVEYRAKRNERATAASRREHRKRGRR